MSKSKLLGQISKTAMGLVAPQIVEQGTKIVRDELEKRKEYKKIPDVKLLSVAEATAIMKQYDFKYSIIKINPDIKYVNSSPDSIVKIHPKGNTNVDPKTFVKMYYIDDDTIEESKLLRKDNETKKLEKKKKMQVQVKNTLKSTAKLTSKIYLKKSKEDNSSVNDQINNEI